MPLLVHAVSGAFAVHRQTVELARQAHGEVGDVDHLLDLALALAGDLAHLERDELAEVLLVLAKEIAELPDDFATRRSRDVTPVTETRLRRLHDLLVVFE